MTITNIIQTIIKRNSKYKNDTYILSLNDFNSLVNDIRDNLKVSNVGLENTDRIESFKSSYYAMCEMVYNKDKPEASEIKNINMESSPPMKISRLTYKDYIDRKIDKLKEAICNSIDKWK